MQAIKGVVQNGQVVLAEPLNWPDGMEVIIEPAMEHDWTGMTEEGQGDDPESIARWIAEFDAIPPLQMTQEEEAAWHAARLAQKDYELSKFLETADKLQGKME